MLVSLFFILGGGSFALLANEIFWLLAGIEEALDQYILFLGMSSGMIFDRVVFFFPFLVLISRGEFVFALY